MTKKTKTANQLVALSTGDLKKCFPKPILLPINYRDHCLETAVKVFRGIDV